VNRALNYIETHETDDVTRTRAIDQQHLMRLGSIERSVGVSFLFASTRGFAAFNIGGMAISEVELATQDVRTLFRQRIGEWSCARKDLHGLSRRRTLPGEAAEMVVGKRGRSRPAKWLC
jgi:hypothetical protein